jgi:predicted acetylornithine/succinylornithine family transaminase
MTVAELQALERSYVLPTYVRFPVQFVRGAGCLLWDDEGTEYLDFLAGISVCNTGHCHPAVVRAVQEQAAQLMHTTNLFYTAPGMELAQALSRSSLGGRVFFANSGAEANEAALKLVRKRRPGGEVVVAMGAFHGRTYGALSATPQEAKQAPFAPLVPGFRVVPRDDPAALDAAVGDDTAAVLIEPIQGETGIWPLSEEMLHTARAACDRTGAALVFDEIQTGMGRTGTLWAYEQTGVRPDALTTAKALGGGLPIGALVTTPELADVLEPGDHGSTFAGGPVVSRAALAALDVIDRPDFLKDVIKKGAILAEGLAELPGVTAVRARGLMQAIEVPNAPDVTKRALLEQHLITNATGPTTIRFEPPLIVTEKEIQEALNRMTQALTPDARRPTPDA